MEAAIHKLVGFCPLPPQPGEKDKAEHMLAHTHTPFQPWCEFCVASGSLGNQHPRVSDPARDARREHPTVQCDFFFMELGKEGAVVALLMVDVWSRCVSAMPLKPRNAQTVGNALVGFFNEVGRVEKMELAGDNEPVLVAGIRFCQRTRQTLGMETILIGRGPMKSQGQALLRGLCKHFVDCRKLRFLI